MALTLPAGARHLVFYDGLCGFCDRWVQRLLRADRRGALAYAPLQGQTAAVVRARHALDPSLDSVLLLENAGLPDERLRVRSDAVLATVRAVGGPWAGGLGLLRGLRLVPRPWRDAAYDAFARRRTRWFARLPACRVPTAAERRRFLP